MVKHSNEFARETELRKARRNGKPKIPECVRKNEYKKVAGVKEMESSIRTRRFFLVLGALLILGIGLLSVFL